MTIGLLYIIGQCERGERYALGPIGQIFDIHSLEQIAIVAPPYSCPFHVHDLKILSVMAAPTRDHKWLHLDKSFHREAVASG